MRCQPNSVGTESTRRTGSDPRETSPFQPECIDSELWSRKLNAYGDPEGTRYAREVPADLTKVAKEYLDTEPLDQGERREAERIAYVLRRHPEIEETCAKRKPAEQDAGRGESDGSAK